MANNFLTADGMGLKICTNVQNRIILKRRTEWSDIFATIFNVKFESGGLTLNSKEIFTCLTLFSSHLRDFIPICSLVTPKVFDVQILRHWIQKVSLLYS